MNILSEKYEVILGINTTGTYAEVLERFKGRSEFLERFSAIYVVLVYSKFHTPFVSKLAEVSIAKYIPSIAMPKTLAKISK